MTENEFCIRPKPYQPNDFVYKIARGQEDLGGFWRLRRDIFCSEQGIFEGSDVDDIDDGMIPIIAKSLLMGMDDEVIGVVRIDEREPGVWWGSRLGVRSDLRRLRSMADSVVVRNRQPDFCKKHSIGAGLIYKAVSTAQALGCRVFLAHVQHQNAAFFQRLHWEPMGEIEMRGVRHVKMRAELDFYPPARHDVAGLRAA